MQKFLNILAFLTYCCALGGWSTAIYANECAPSIFNGTTLVRQDVPLEIASLLAGYPTLGYDPVANELTLANKDPFTLDVATDLTGEELLDHASLIDQFRFVYPLDFTLIQRETPWHDPGRIRNGAFFEFLYSSSRNSVENSLTDVSMPGSKTIFTVTTQHNVACQLSSALAEIGTAYPRLFANVGGSYNWRKISGTNRLSVHSFGAAIDVNAEIGGYWKWSGRKSGKAGSYANRVPQEVVQIFEKYGFIWGGKWHHFDGMHFEYRPELIIYSNHISKSD